MPYSSSNYALYGDLSNRVMETLRTFSPQVEVYSIDEAFVRVSPYTGVSWEETAHRMRQTIRR